MAPVLEEFVQWLSAARAGSREALGNCFESCRIYLHSIARQEIAPQLQGKGGASDIVQETFLEAQRRLRPLQRQFEVRTAGVAPASAPPPSCQVRPPLSVDAKTQTRARSSSAGRSPTSASERQSSGRAINPQRTRYGR